MTTASPQQAARPKVQAADEDVLGTAVMVELHRLVKQATLYTSENEAQRQQLQAAQQAFMDFGRRTGANPRIYFADKSVYIGRRLFRAGRQVYESALEVAEILRRFGIDEIAIGYDIPVDELKTFQTTLGLALRNAGPPPQTVRYARLRLRKGRPLKARRMNEHLSPQEVLVRSYCLAVVAVRRFLESIQRGKMDSLNTVQRVAEQLVDVTHELTSKQSPAFLAGVVLYNVRGESAGRAVNAAMLSLAMTRQLSDQLSTLSRVAMASLLYDVGLPRVAGTGPEGEDRVGAMLPRIGVEQERELPAATAVVVTALNGCSDAGMMHAALVYEALSLNMRENARAAYAGVHAVSLEARIVATSRRFTELLADPDEERTAEQAMMQLLREARDEAYKTTARMLMAALGMYPTGTTVELSSGQVARVLQTPNDPRRFGFPVVQPVLDASGGTLDNAPPLDLGSVADQGVYVSRVTALGDGTTEARAGRRPTAPGGVPAAVAAVQAPGGSSSQGARRITVRVATHVPEIGDSPTDIQPGLVALAQEALGQAHTPQPISTPNITPQPTPSPQHTPRPIALGRLELTPPPNRSPVAVPQIVPTPRFTEPVANQRRHEFADALSAKADDSDALAVDLPSDDGQLGAFGAGLVAQHSDDGSTMVYDPSAGPGPEAMVPPMPGRAVAITAERDEPIEVALDAALDAAFQHGESLSDLATTSEIDRPTRDDSLSDFATTGETSTADDLSLPTDQAIPPPAGLPADMLGASSLSESDAYPDAAAERRIAERAQPAFDWFEERADGLAPTAEGVLRKTPLTNLLVYLLDQQLTGTVVLTSAAADAIHAFTVEEGRPINVRTFGDVAPLDQVLLSLGVIEAESLQASRAAIERSGELHGAYLVRTGMVDETMVEIALRMQAQQKLEHVLSLPEDTNYMFFKGHNLLAGYGGPERVEVDPLALITIGVRQRKRDPLIDQTLARLGQLPLGIHPLAEIGRLGFDRRESAVVDALLEQPRSLQALAAAGVAPVEVLKRAAYTLTITRSLELGTNAKPPVGYVDAPPPSVADLPPPVFPTMAPPASFDPSRLPAMTTGPFAAETPAPAAPTAPPAPTRVGGSAPTSAAPDAASAEEHDEVSLDDTAGTVVLVSSVDAAAAFAPAPPRPPLPMAAGAPLQPRPPIPPVANAPPPSRPSAPGPASLPTSVSSDPGMRPRPPVEVSRVPPPRPPTARPPMPSAPPASSPVPGPSEAQRSSVAPAGLPPRPPRPPGATGLPPAPSVAAGTPLPPPSAPVATPPLAARPAAPATPSPQTSPVAVSAPAQAPAAAAAPAGAKKGLTHEAVEQRASEIETQNFFEILGVAQDTPTPAVQTAYFMLAKVWHPDRTPADLAELKPQIQKVFARISEAFQTLQDPTKRAAYVESLKSGGGSHAEREQLEKAVDSVMLFEKASVLVKRGSFAQAEVLLQRCVEADPQQPEYRAVYAWVQALRMGDPPALAPGQKVDTYQSQLQELDRALADSPDFEKALFYRAELYKRSGMAEQALRDFKKVVQLNPRNIDAAREVRIHEMRNPKPSQPQPSSGGLFGKLFKKD